MCDVVLCLLAIKNISTANVVRLNVSSVFGDVVCCSFRLGSRVRSDILISRYQPITPFVPIRLSFSGFNFKMVIEVQ